MAQLTMAQAYAYARQAGFDPSAAVVMAAIAAGESGLRTDAVGDKNLVDAKWGPSVGLTQIRTVKADTGTGRDRDIERLSDPLQNMISAYHISSHGHDFTPWTVYTSGKYRQFLGQAQASAGTPGVSVAGTPIASTSSASWSDVARDWAVRLLVAGLGVGLVVAGTRQAWLPVVRKARSVAKKAAMAAAV